MEFPAASRSQIEHVMRRALGSNAAQLNDWQWHLLPYHVVLADRILARGTGSALLGNHERVAWSSVVKVIRRTALGVTPIHAAGHSSSSGWRRDTSASSTARI